MPVVNHLLERLGLETLLERFVPTEDRRTRIPHARCLGVLLRSITVEREPIYREAAWVSAFAPVRGARRPARSAGSYHP